MRLLIVGTLEGYITEAGKIAHQRGAKVIHVETINKALDALRSGKGADLLMVDVVLDIAGLITSLKNERIYVPVVACGLGEESDPAVEAIRAGAQEYVPLPPDPELISAVLEAISREDQAVIYCDPETQRIFKMAEQIAPSEASVLITGESGTGKEVMARYVHQHSRRKDKPFVSVNCAAIPENLLESELFGHEKGSFTGAIARRIGKFEEADGGTLLLDEISEMHPSLQAKLLRAIQEREIDRVGGRQPVKVNIRLLATSNRNLREDVKAGKFREDLYFRLNVVSLELPPLRKRPHDIEMLADYFVEKFSTLNALPLRCLSPQAKKMLEAYSWPGNVRELENIMHRAVLLATGSEIGKEAIILPDMDSVEDSAFLETGESSASLVGKTVAEVERGLILDTLKHCFGNRTHAANILGISIRTLRNKLKQYTEEGTLKVREENGRSSLPNPYQQKTA